jgi:ADP-heptose:LPS heptosyltransferase
MMIMTQLLSLLSRPFKTPRIKDLNRIALLCYGGLGDVLLFSPVIAEIKAWLPEASITLYLEERSMGVSSVLAGVDAVQIIPTGSRNKLQLFKFLVTDLKKRHFDAVLSCGTNQFIPYMLAATGIPYRVGYQTTGYGQQLLSHQAVLNQATYASCMYFELAKAFMKPLIGPAYEPFLQPHQLKPIALPPSDRDLDELKGIALQPNQGTHRHHILLHPGVSQMSLSKGINKTWSALDWSQLILSLSKLHCVYLVGGKDDEPLVTDILAHLPENLQRFSNLMGTTRNFSDLAGLMTIMDAVVCVDSAPLHLAIALGKPTVAIFGPTDEEKLLPNPQWVPSVKAVTVEGLACRPCLWAVRQQNCETSDCLRVSPETVETAVLGLLR